MKRELKVLVATSSDTKDKAFSALPPSRYRLATAPPNAEKVVQAVLIEQSDVVILDMTRPKPEDASVVRRIREQAPHLKVVFLANVESLARRPGLGRAADEVVLQPFAPAELRFRVERAVQHTPGPYSKPPLLVADLHDRKTGRIDAKRLAEYLALPLSALARAVGRDYKGVFKTPASESLQPVLEPIHRTAVALHRYFRHRRETLAWLNTPNPELDGQRPRDLVLEGKAEVIADMLEASLAGVVT